MNKKEIASVRKEFKADSYKLRVKDIFTVYVKKESDEIFHQQHSSFSMLELEQQELFLQNFKKVLLGNLDEKLFELKFERDSKKANAQDKLLESIHCDSDHWQKLMLEFVENAFSDERKYKEDIVFTFIRAEYYISLNKKKKGKSSEDDTEERAVKESFIFCSMNKTTQPKKALLFDYVKKEFKSNLVLDAMINLTTPIQGFMFPTIQGANVDVNRVLYSTSKKNLPDLHFIKSVLNCDTDEVITSDSDVAYFNEVLINVLGGRTNPKVISNVYHKIEKIVVSEKEAEEDEAVMLDYKDITNILVASGVEVEDPKDIQRALKDVVDDEKYEFKAENLMTNKKITIETEPVKLAVEAQNLEKVRQIHHEGKLCLLIEIDKNVEVNGLMIETEKEEE